MYLSQWLQSVKKINYRLQWTEIGRMVERIKKNIEKSFSNANRIPIAGKRKFIENEGNKKETLGLFRTK